MKENRDVIIYKSSEDNISISVFLENETVWLSIDQMAELFNKGRSTINEHILNIYAEKELVEENTMRKIGISDFSTKPTNYYNLDVIISVGYRVKSVQGTRFRQWATLRLKEYIIKGFTMDDERLKNLGGGNYWKELLDRIRDIRSSEKVMYRQVLELYSTATDYDSKSEESLTFFKIVQNKLHYAAYFDLAELNAIEHREMRMVDYVRELDNILASTKRKVLDNSGKISHSQAQEKAMLEYKKYKVKTLSPVENDYLKTIAELEKKAKKGSRNNSTHK